jgi:DNA-binding NtrC family response regulator
VRELRNQVERAVIMAGEGEIRLQHLPGAVHAPQTEATQVSPAAQPAQQDVLQVRVGIPMSEVEEAYVRLTLRHTNNNKTRAAELLGLCLRTLHNKIRSYENGSVRIASAGEATFD